MRGAVQIVRPFRSRGDGWCGGLSASRRALRDARVAPRRRASGSHVVNLHPLPDARKILHEALMKLVLLVPVVRRLVVEQNDERPRVGAVDHGTRRRRFRAPDVAGLDVGDSHQAPAARFERRRHDRVGVGLQPKVHGVNEHAGPTYQAAHEDREASPAEQPFAGKAHALKHLHFPTFRKRERHYSAGRPYGCLVGPESDGTFDARGCAVAIFHINQCLVTVVTVVERELGRLFQKK